MTAIHVVSHTHWDREWYHPAERFRQRLVTLVDELLDDPPQAGTSFLLDGQAVVLDDYLDVRPERTSELSQALRSGKLEAGPWYVLPDELIPSGEGLIRNLLAGDQVMRRLRAASPPVLYCPDSFGHPAALPDLARGFGKSVAILWRGLGGRRWPRGNVFQWEAASGERVLLYHLTSSGYELGSSLPTGDTAAGARWARIRKEFGTRGTVPIELLLNGADHHARQRNLPAALAALEKAASPDTIEPGSLMRFAAAVESLAITTKLPSLRGELRDSYGYTWTLQGALASRTPQKREYVIRERELLRDVEPWVALAALAGRGSRRHLTHAAWRSLLLCQPHDTLCGCSIDQVARAMAARLEAARAQSEGLREDALLDLIGHDRDAARAQPDAWQPVVLVRNRAARPRSGVAIVEITAKVADVPVGPGSAPPRHRARISAPRYADVTLTHERIEAPRAYPDNDAVLRFSAAMWVTDVPAYGVAAMPLSQPPDEAGSRFTSTPPQPVVSKPRMLSNGRVTLRWDARGKVSVEDAASGRVVRDIVGWESVEDSGDLYTPSTGRSKLRPRLVATKMLHSGPVIGAVEQRWRLGGARGAGHMELTVRFVLEAGTPFIRLGILGDNAARDHRLRLAIRTDVSDGVTVADAAFGPISRSMPAIPAADARMERPVPTAPLHRYVSLFGKRRGATLFSDGLTEYETRKDRIFVTLLRSVGELSRNDLPERPGHAGWPASTPEAQCIGLFQAEFGLMLHGPRSAGTIADIEQAADDVLYPLTGDTLRSALTLPAPVAGVALSGEGLAFSAMKESEDGAWTVLRCVNLVETAVAGAWTLGGGIVPREARLARLDETPLEPLALSASRISFMAAPRAIVTVLVR